MSKSKIVWLPAGLALLAAILLIVYSYDLPVLRHIEHGGHRIGGGPRPADADDGRALKGWITTLGTIVLYAGALNFSWFWFKKKMKSPSKLVRKAGKLLYKAHKWIGWGLLIIIAIHGGYFIITDWNNHKVYSGLGAFAMLLAIGGYGVLIRKVRNKWMRSVHRWLSVAWAPVLLLHAGGSVILAVMACLGIYGLVWILERKAAVAS